MSYILICLTWSVKQKWTIHWHLSHQKCKTMNYTLTYVSPASQQVWVESGFLLAALPGPVGLRWSWAPRLPCRWQCSPAWPGSHGTPEQSTWAGRWSRCVWSVSWSHLLHCPALWDIQELITYPFNVCAVWIHMRIDHTPIQCKACIYENWSHTNSMYGLHEYIWELITPIQCMNWLLTMLFW